MKIRQYTEQFIERWSEMVVSHRWQTLIITLLVSAIIIPQIRHGHLDVSIESYLPHGNQTMVDYNEFRQEFDYTIGAVLAVEVAEGDIFNMQTLSELKRFHDELESNTPYLKKITSLVNVRHTYATEDALSVDELYESWPETEAEIPAFKAMVLANPNYVPNLVSRDGRMTTLVVEPNVYTSLGEDDDLALEGFNDDFNTESFDFDSNVAPDYLTSDEETLFAEEIIRITDEFSSENFKIFAAGGPMMNYILGKDMEKSTQDATLLGFVIIIILLTILFKRFSGIFLPLVVVFLSLASTMAFYPILGIPFNGNTQIIPTFVLAVGIADSVHILSIFYKHYDAGMDKHQAIVTTMKQTAIAVLMTTITTAASLLSFLTAEMVPTQTMGGLGAIGVVMALIYTLVLLPSILAIVPVKRKAQSNKQSLLLSKIDIMIHSCGQLGMNHAKGIVILTSVLSIIFLVGVARTQFSHDPVAWYNNDAPLRQAIHRIDNDGNGSLAVQILLESDKPNALHEPQLLKAIEEIEQVAEAHRFKDVQAKDAISILSVVKETHQALNNNDPAAFTIPESKQAIAQELLLFENSGSDDVYDFTDSNFSVARIDLQIGWSNVINYHQYIITLMEKIDAVLVEHQLTDVEAKPVGLLRMMSETVLAMLWGTVESYLLAFILVGILMFLLMETIRHGLLAFSPNITPILFTVGLMGLFSTPLNMFSSLLGCVIIGISVDDTIHFMHHFRQHIKKHNDVQAAIHHTLDMCGRAITFTSIVLIGGFIVHLTGVFSVNREFGYLLSFAIFLALFANLILAPALLTLFWKREDHKQEPA